MEFVGQISRFKSATGVRHSGNAHLIFILSSRTEYRIILTENKLDEYGLALFGLVANHPVSDLETKYELEVALASLGLDPNDPRVLSGMEKGKALDVDQTVNDLLTRFGE